MLISSYRFFHRLYKNSGTWDWGGIQQQKHHVWRAKINLLVQSWNVSLFLSVILIGIGHGSLNLFEDKLAYRLLQWRIDERIHDHSYVPIDFYEWMNEWMNVLSSESPTSHSAESNFELFIRILITFRVRTADSRLRCSKASLTIQSWQ